MQLFEHEAKAQLAARGVSVPPGILLSQPQLPFDAPVPAAVKAQVLSGKRGKAGGVILTGTRGETEAAVGALLNRTVLGLPVSTVLVEERLDVDRELYVSLYLDRQALAPALLVIPHGGVEVEASDAAEVLRLPVDVFVGPRPHHKRAVMHALGLPAAHATELDRVLDGMWATFLECDATLLEVNPLILTRRGHLVAADARMLIDDRAAGAHPEFAGERDGLTAFESAAAARLAVGVEMNGDTAVVTSGAGVMMATADSLLARGARPGPLLDLGGFSRSVAEQGDVMRLVLGCSPRVVFVNFFTQVLRCDDLAEAIVAAFGGSGARVVARLTGHMADQGREIVRAAGMQVSDAYGAACEMVVSA